MIVPTFAATLRKYRERAGITQSELGRRASVGHSMISRLEAGFRVPSRETVDALAIGLELSPADETKLRTAMFGTLATDPANIDPLALKVNRTILRLKDCHYVTGYRNLEFAINAAIGQVERMEAGKS